MQNRDDLEGLPGIVICNNLDSHCVIFISDDDLEKLGYARKDKNNESYTESTNCPLDLHWDD